MKKVRNYLREVLEMKSKEVWVSFEEKCEFLCEGVAECKKTWILKIDISGPLKIVFFCISRASHKPSRKICNCKGQNLTIQVWVTRDSRNSLSKIFKNWNFLKISWLVATCGTSSEMAKDKVLQQWKIDILGNILRTKVTKITSRNTWNT